METTTHGCGQQVLTLTDPDGRTRLLDPQPSWLGIWAPAAGGRCRKLTTVELWARRRQNTPAGHQTHTCPPRPAAPAGQPTLFDSGQP